MAEEGTHWFRWFFEDMWVGWRDLWDRLIRGWRCRCWGIYVRFKGMVGEVVGQKRQCVKPLTLEQSLQYDAPVQTVCRDIGELQHGTLRGKSRFQGYRTVRGNVLWVPSPLYWVSHRRSAIEHGRLSRCMQIPAGFAWLNGASYMRQRVEATNLTLASLVCFPACYIGPHHFQLRRIYMAWEASRKLRWLFISLTWTLLTRKGLAPSLIHSRHLTSTSRPDFA